MIWKSWHRTAGDEFSFRPAAGGGITQFTLGDEIVETADGRHKVKLLKETQSPTSHRAKFRWAFGGESFTFVIKSRLEERP